MHRFLRVVAAALFVSSAQASEPGQPLDGPDWVPTLPGLSSRNYRGIQPNRPSCCYGPPGDACTWRGGNSVDAEGNLFFLRPDAVHTGTYCGSRELLREEVYRIRKSDGARQLVAYLEDRCLPDFNVDNWEWETCDAGSFPDARFNFDPTTGVLRFWVRSFGAWVGPIPQGFQTTIVEISGFATTFDILQTYTPSISELGFRVPYMPEGFPAADYFDTYYGDLATVGDWSQAQPLQCGYPSTPPQVGDYLSVADPLPDPAPGTGRYYVTAVTHQGQRRYGRKSTSGVLSGRDPAVLPECSR